VRWRSTMQGYDVWKGWTENRKGLLEISGGDIYVGVVAFIFFSLCGFCLYSIIPHFSTSY